MPKIVSVHSFRGGTGKSNLTANLGANLAMNDHRVGLVDTDIQSPGIHAPSAWTRSGWAAGYEVGRLNDGLARKLEVPELVLAVNKALATVDIAALRQQVELGGTGSLWQRSCPLSEDLVRMASCFSLREPIHAWSPEVRGIAERIVG